MYIYTADMIRVIKWRRLMWAGHVARRGSLEMRTKFDRKPEGDLGYDPEYRYQISD
jgi:hypothetical protein